VKSPSLRAGVLLVLVLAGKLEAQDPAEPIPRDTPGSPSRFFDRPIDYWQRGLRYENAGGGGRDDRSRALATGAPPPPSDWSQVVKQPDGSFAVHELPKPLIQVLDNPSPENIRAYLEWRSTRAEKILRAAELLREYPRPSRVQPGDGDPLRPNAPSPPEGGALRPPDSSPAPEPAAREAPARRPFTLWYFHKHGCPHCDHQDVILREWLSDKPEGRLEIVEFGSRADLWRAYQVRGTPSIVLEDGASRAGAFLEGLSSREALSAALGECQRAAVRGVPKTGDPRP